MKRTCKVIPLALAVTALVIPAIAHRSNFRTIDPPGSKFTFPFGINPQGEIVAPPDVSGLLKPWAAT